MSLKAAALHVLDANSGAWVPAFGDLFVASSSVRTGALDATSSGGVVWDGITDDTAALTAKAAEALALGVPLRLPPGTGVAANWIPPSGLTVIGFGSGKTILKLLPTATGASTVLVNAANTTGVTLIGLTLDGNRTAFGAVSTEHKHALDVRGAQSLTLFDVKAINAKGDGIYFGTGSSYCKGIRATNVTVDNNYRNGVSIIAMDDGKFVGCDFLNTTGSNPQAGLDIEPNVNTEVVKDLRFFGCTFQGNVNEGVIVTLKPDGPVRQGRIRFVGCTIKGNGASGAQIYRGDSVSFTDCDIVENALYGIYVSYGTSRNITIRGGSISRNGREGINARANVLPNLQTIAMAGTVTGGTFPLTFSGQTVTGIPWNADGATIKAAIESLSNVADGDIVVLGAGPLPAIPVVVNFTGSSPAPPVPVMTTSSASLTGGGTVSVAQVRGSIYNLKILFVNIEDNGTSAANTYDGIFLGSDDTTGTVDGVWIEGVTSGNVATVNQARGLNASSKVINLTAIDNDFRNNANTPVAFNDDAPTRHALNNRGVSTVASVTATATLNSFAEIASCAPASGAITVTLPASPVSDRTYLIYDNGGLASTRNITIVANTGHTIRNSGGVVSITTNFGLVEMFFRGGNWFVVSKTT